MSWPKFVSNKSQDIFELESFSAFSDTALYAQIFSKDPVFVTRQDLANGFYIGWDDKEQITIQKSSKKTKYCEYDWQHIWKKYCGFNEVYEFCEICDKKRPVKDK